MKVYAITDVGRVRPINEDSHYLPRSGERFCAVADGMGGHNAGEVASAMAVETFANCMRASDRLNAAAIRDAVARANEVVFEEAAFLFPNMKPSVRRWKRRSRRFAESSRPAANWTI